MRKTVNLNRRVVEMVKFPDAEEIVIVVDEVVMWKEAGLRKIEIETMTCNHGIHTIISSQEIQIICKIAQILFFRNFNAGIGKPKNLAFLQSFCPSPQGLMQLHAA